MKLKKSIPEKTPVQTALYDALRKFLGASKELMTVLQANPVISSDELKEAGRKLLDVKHIIAGVLNRTGKVRPIVENSELYAQSDTQLTVKLESQEQDISYLVGIATTMLDKLRQKQHITEKEYDTLMRYWLSLPEQHQRLIDRWETARNT